MLAKAKPVPTYDDLIAKTLAGYTRMVSVRQTAEILGVHDRHVRAMIERGELPAVKLRQTQRGAVRIPLAAIEALMRAGMAA